MKNNKILILGATSDVARETAIIACSKGVKSLVLSARNSQRLEPLKKDLELKFQVQVSLLELDAADTTSHKNILQPVLPDTDVVFCFWGYLGSQEKAQTDLNEAMMQVTANFTGCVSALNYVAEVFEKKKDGILVGVSSVAGIRGRQSNYIYGSAKAGFTAYLSGLRNRLIKNNVHVMTVLPGFMDTRMTADLDLPKPLTSSPQKAASLIWEGMSKKKNIIYVSGIWKWIMLVIKNIPEFIFKKLSM